MAQLHYNVTNRIPERIAEMRSRSATALEESGKEAFEPIEDEARALSRARIRSDFGGGLVESFVTEAIASEDRAIVTLENEQPHMINVEKGRRAGSPVEAPYVDNSQNRRLGRVGKSYVHHYTLMPPAGIFRDDDPDYARRRKIARDGIPPKNIFRDLKRWVDVAALGRRFKAALSRRLFGGGA